MISLKQFKKVLLIRVDRLGDLIVTLPVDQLLPESEVTWVVPKGLAFVPFYAVPRRKSLELGRTLKDVWRFFWFVRGGTFDAAVVFHGPWWVSFILWCAGVPVRVGVRSQWHSFLFFNHSIRQRRSEARYHELEYNRQLLERGLVTNEQKVLKPLVLDCDPDPEFMNRHCLTAKNYFVVHPGMGGSARNWSTDNYIQLIKNISVTNFVVVSAGPGDLKMVEPIKKSLGSLNNVRFLILKNEVEWLSLLKNAKGVVAPSTGTAHIAAALGTPTVGVYSPVLVQAPRRWGPLGPRVKVMVPKVDCPGVRACFMEACPKFDCMNLMTVESVQEELFSLSKIE